MTVDDYFADGLGTELERPVFDAVIDVVAHIGAVLIEPVSVGIFIKRPDGSRYLQLRPMKRWVALSFSLDRKLTHPKVSRKPVDYAGRWFHVLNVDGPAAIDETVAEWLGEAYRTG